MRTAFTATADGPLDIGMTTPTPSDRTPDGGVDAERRQAGKEASVLFVLLSEQPDDPALKARVEAWCAESALHKEVWARTCRTYRMMGGSPALYEAEWRSPVARREVPPTPTRVATVMPHPRPRRTRRLLAAASLAVAACLAIAVAPAALLRLEADAVTSTAELRTIDLGDGSRIRLAPRSAIGIDFSQNERRVRLLQGEAFFDVTPDARRPFRVVANDVVATVLGTAFEVTLQDDGATVAVQHGQVRVDGEKARQSANLQAGDWMRVKADAVAERGTRAPGDIGDWTTGQFVARNRPIAEIVDRLRGYYGGMIIIRDDAFARRLVSGVYDLSDPDATLRNLASAHDAVVRQVSPWMLLVTAR
jgi:transmembrane sensor